MVSYAKLIGRGLLWYRAIRYHSNTIKHQAFLEKSQWWSLDQLEKLQNERLRTLIKHAGENVPYYKRLFKELAINTDNFNIDQLNLIPPVTKDVIKSKYSEFISVNAHSYAHIKTSTSGSTGSPFNYLLDLSANELQEACAFRGMSYAGYQYGDKIIRIGGSAIIPGDLLTTRQMFSNFIQRIKPLAAIRMDPDKLDNFVREINEFRPSIICGYPSSIYTLANFIEANERNLKCFPNAVITTAELLLPKYREKIQKVFSCPVFDEYGCNDGGLISYECNEHNGFHYAAERAIVEIAMDGGSLFPKGYGEVMLTDLHNFSMPFIRYKNGDIAKLSTEKCPCGRSLPLIEAVQGRSGDVLKFYDRYIATPALTLIFKDFSFDRYQLIKKADDQIEINVIKSKSYNHQEEQRLINILRYHLGGNVSIRLNFVSDIETTAAGKWKFFIDASENQSTT